MNPLGQLAHPVVRDLAWAVFSDDLMLAESLGSPAHPVHRCALWQLTPARLSWLLALDASPDALLAQVGPRMHQRLGLYFEALWHFFLENDAAAELLAHNLPIRAADRTLGEFDCLYRCRDSGDIAHLELAVKFYLHTGAGSGGSADDRADWLGPGRRDRLDRKLNHLSEHQTRLAGQPAARRLLHDRGLVPDRVEVAVKGRLFRHPDQPERPPTGFNPASSILRWHHVGMLDDDCRETDSAAYVILPRRYWLAPLAPAALINPAIVRLPADRTALKHALEDRFTARNTPVLVATLGADQRERRRFFVAPTGWPGSER